MKRLLLIFLFAPLLSSSQDSLKLKRDVYLGLSESISMNLNQKTWTLKSFLPSIQLTFNKFKIPQTHILQVSDLSYSTIRSEDTTYWGDPISQKTKWLKFNLKYEYNFRFNNNSNKLWPYLGIYWNYFLEGINATIIGMSYNPYWNSGWSFKHILQLGFTPGVRYNVNEKFAVRINSYFNILTTDSESSKLYFRLQKGLKVNYIPIRISLLIKLNN